MHLSRLRQTLTPDLRFGRSLCCGLALLALVASAGCDKQINEDEQVTVVPESETELADAGDAASSTSVPPAALDTVPPAALDTVPAAAVEALETQPELPSPPKQLGIGDPSPGLHVASWIKGSPLNETLDGKVHVVEFWATWCGPCRVSMPHISGLQAEYGDEVAFVGITREDMATVEKFLNSDAPSGKTWDEVIDYRLAIDDRDWMSKAYMRAAGQSGIPAAFVVGRDGVVDWIGHPGRIDEPLNQIVAGTWDREQAIVERKQQQRLQELQSQITNLARTQQWDQALKLLDELETTGGKTRVITAFRLMLLERAGRDEEAANLRVEQIDDAWDNPQALNEIAWKIATSGQSTSLQEALRAAERASELTEHKDGSILDTVARVYYELGQLDQAIEWQQRAAEHNPGIQQIEDTLERYLSEQEKATKPASEAVPTNEADSPGESEEQPADGKKSVDD